MPRFTSDVCLLGYADARDAAGLPEMDDDLPLEVEYEMYRGDIDDIRVTFGRATMEFDDLTVAAQCRVEEAAWADLER